MIHHVLSRRQLLRVALGTNALALGFRRLAWAQTLLKRTPDQILGPFSSSASRRSGGVGVSGVQGVMAPSWWSPRKISRAGRHILVSAM